MKFFNTGLLFLVFCLLNFNCSEKTGKINGVSLVSTPHKVESENILAIKKISADWVALIPYGFSRSGEPKVYYNSDRQWWGEKPEGIKHTAKLAKENGFKIMLKPQIWVGGEGWTGDFTLNSESDWKIWEKTYSAYILQMAKLAESLHIELLCIGTEYKMAVKNRPNFWVELIKKTRKIYHGKLTYAANWDNFQNIPFWKSLDYIGVDAYFPLSQNPTPSVDELKTAWKKPAAALEKIHQNNQKPLLFTEYGYRNIDKSAGNQWELPSSRSYEGELNNTAQINSYQAFYEIFWNKKWVAGGFLWKWFPQYETMKGRKNSGFTPQHKPVEKTIEKFYGK